VGKGEVYIFRGVEIGHWDGVWGREIWSHVLR
jgi:hypothetical protein